LKNRGISLLLPLSLKVDWRERMTSSELSCEVCAAHFKWIKGENGWI